MSKAVIAAMRGALANPQNQLICLDKADIAAVCDSSEDLLADARFLCERLREFENEDVGKEGARQFHGHVAPALARLEAAIAKAGGA